MDATAAHAVLHTLEGPGPGANTHAELKGITGQTKGTVKGLLGGKGLWKGRGVYECRCAGAWCGGGGRKPETWDAEVPDWYRLGWEKNSTSIPLWAQWICWVGCCSVSTARTAGFIQQLLIKPSLELPGEPDTNLFASSK